MIVIVRGINRNKSDRGGINSGITPTKRCHEVWLTVPRARGASPTTQNTKGTRLPTSVFMTQPVGEVEDFDDSITTQKCVKDIVAVLLPPPPPKKKKWVPTRN